MWLVFAALSSFFFALRGILFQIYSRKPADRNLILIGMFWSGSAVTIICSIVSRSAWDTVAWIGVLMGVLSYIGNMSMYRAFAAGKAAYIALLISIAPVVVTILAYVFWREWMTNVQLIALIIIMCGLIVVRVSGDFSFHVRSGTVWALTAMFAFSFIDLLSKQAMLHDASIFPLSFLMFLAGALCFMAHYAVDRLRAKTAHGFVTRVPGQWSAVRCLGAGFAVGIAASGGLVFSLPAMKLGNTGLVTAVISAQIVLIVLYAAIFRRERIRPWEYIGIAILLAGVSLLVY